MRPSFEAAEAAAGKYYELPISGRSATSILNNYHRGFSDFPGSPEEQALIYAYLVAQSSKVENPTHRADPKRADRRNGQRMRKARTGSRRG